MGTSRNWEKLKRSAAYMAIILMLGAGVGYYLILKTTEITSDPDAIVDAMFDNTSTSKRIKAAIDAYGDVNGFSERHNLSFITAAVISHDRDMLEWLLEKGANPNPERGLHPLSLSSIRSPERNLLVAAGSRQPNEEPATTERQ